MNIRYQQHLQSHDLVLEMQLAFLQPPNGELIGEFIMHETREHNVQISVLFLEMGNTLPDRFYRDRHHAYGQETGKDAILAPAAPTIKESA